MKIALISTSALTGLLLLSTLICGLWIRNAGDQVTDPASSIAFHSNIAIATTVVGMVLVALVLFSR
jgi:hypothetical protein